MGKKLFYYFGKKNKKYIVKKEFEIALKQNILERVDRGFIKTYKPIMDDIPYRIFKSMRDYKNWCNKKLPRWLGYGKAK